MSDKGYSHRNDFISELLRFMVVLRKKGYAFELNFLFLYVKIRALDNRYSSSQVSVTRNAPATLACLLWFCTKSRKPLERCSCDDHFSAKREGDQGPSDSTEATSDLFPPSSGLRSVSPRFNVDSDAVERNLDNETSSRSSWSSLRLADILRI